MVAITSEVVAIMLVCISVVIAYDAVLQHDAIAERMQRRDKMDLEKIDEAVEMCCPLENSECCRRAILFHEPINCTGLNARRRLDTADCVERHLFGNEPKPFVRDRICCEVYGDNHNDRDDVCRSLCNTIAMTPSLPRHAKLERIRHCKMANHGLTERSKFGNVRVVS
ncbi:HER-1identical [Aphelenchoides avenae]|nr:HER-1identical [Aphelenchus avenae]